MLPEAATAPALHRSLGAQKASAGSKGVDPRTVLGLVLAGGRSIRMGREKALLRVGGETLLERQLRILRAVGLSEVILSLRSDLLPALTGTSLAGLASRRESHPDLPGSPEPGRSVFPGNPHEPILLVDEVEGLGPLAGITQALGHAGDRHLLVLAVDMPEVRPSLLHHLLSRGERDRGVAPRIGGRWEPLCALYPPDAYAKALLRLESDTPSPARLLDDLALEGRVRGIALSRDATLTLRSWNTPGDAESAT